MVDLVEEWTSSYKLRHVFFIMIYYKTSFYTSRDNDIILNIIIYTKIKTNILHGPPSKTLLYIMNAILTTHVRVQCLKSVR